MKGCKPYDPCLCAAKNWVQDFFPQSELRICHHIKVQFATEQRSRACWEEICAENFQVEVYLGKIGSGKKGESLFVQVFRSSCWRDVLCKAF